MMLARPTHDLDFVMPSNAIPTSRRVANTLGGAFFPLDADRDTGRVLLSAPEQGQLILDFSSFRGPDLQSDLLGRDFTINAMALDLRNLQTLIDPLHGASDLRAGVLRACSETALQDDPVRILRCIRLAVEFELKIIPELRRQMHQAQPGLANVTAERLRDEIFKMLLGRSPLTALRTCDILGILDDILPELPPLKNVSQSKPHVEDVWEHTLNTAQKLDTLISILQPRHDPQEAANWTMGLVSLRLGRYRQQIEQHLNTPLNPDRPLRALLLVAALYHDTGKPDTFQRVEDGRIRFLEHEALGAELVRQRGKAWRLSNPEIERLATIVRHHMRPLLLAQAPETPSPRAIYRFFRDTGPAGVDICLLSLADTLATYGVTLPQAVWNRQLDVARILLEAWWERPQESVSPPALVNGNDLMEIFRLAPGPQIGQLLEQIREAQAAGELQNRDAALQFVRTQLQ